MWPGNQLIVMRVIYQQRAGAGRRPHTICFKYRTLGYNPGMKHITHQSVLWSLSIILCAATSGYAEETLSDAAAEVSSSDEVQAVVGELEEQLETLREKLIGDEEAVEEADEAGDTAEDAEATATEAAEVTPEPEPEPVKLNKKQRQICEELGIDQDQLRGLIAKPLYEFSEPEIDVYLRYLTAFRPELPDRIRHLARKNIGQPYEIYLLGEMPFEHYDPQPLYCLTKSDCLVFTEHTYAMALSDSWPGFIRMLQRIRYADGQIGVATRNHYTEADWNPNNRWLVRDITSELARQRGVKFAQKVDRAKFLLKRYKLETDFPIEERVDVYLPFEYIDQAKARLRDGDFVNIVRGIPPKAGSEDKAQSRVGTMQDIFGGSAWVGHTGMIVLGDDGEVHLIHSARPSVREVPIDDYIATSTENLAERDAAGKARLLGFKFLRLQKDPLANLRSIDGEDAPKVTLPGGGNLE
jgi:N-acetylmuramoyl-L-alanine amidase-like